MNKVRSYLKKIADIVKYRLWVAGSVAKENKKLFAGVIVAAVMVIGCLCWFFLRTYHDYKVVHSIERKGDTSANYYFCEDGIVCYSKDGISFMDEDGNAVWNQVFGMDAPKMSTCGDYIAVGDVGANTVYIFNNDGMEGKIALEKPLQDLRVSKQGVIAVILSDEAANQINLYSKKGEILASVKATIAATGYPLTLALSEDGTRLAVSYIVFDAGRVSSKLIFYDFSDKETSSTPAGEFSYDTLLPKVEFVDMHTVLVCGGTGFYTYRFKGTVSEQNYQAYAAEARSIFVTDKNIGIITKNTETEEEENAEKYQVEVYRFTGRRVASFKLDFDYKYVSASNSNIIFYNNQECEIYTYRGHKKFQHVFEHNIESILPGQRSGEYILMDSQNVQMIKLK